MSDAATNDPPRVRVSRIAIYLALIVLAGCYLAPLIVVALNSVRDTQEILRTSVIGWPQALHLENWARAWSSYCVNGRCEGISPFVWNSFTIAVPATIISTFLGALNGYTLALRRFPGDNIVFGIMVFGIFLPEQMKLIPWAFVLTELGLSNTKTGLVVLHCVQGLSFATLFCRNYYLAIPTELLKAARIDGAGFFRIFFQIVLPLSAPILIVTTIWQFTGIWNEFLYAVTFTSGSNQPVMAAVAAATSVTVQSPDYGIQSAAVLIAALPTLLIYFFGGRYFVRGLTAGAVK